MRYEKPHMPFDQQLNLLESNKGRSGDYTRVNETELPAHAAALEDAVHSLAGRTSTTITRDDDTTEIVFGEPLIDQLAAYITGAQGTRNGNPARSMPPIVVDVLDLLTEIDAMTAAWVPDLLDRTDRLWSLADRSWRPQDVPEVQAMTDLIESWTVKAQELLDPPRRWTLPSPCPACGTKVVYRRDSAGETVRQPALQISEHGCQCQACRHLWEPAYFAHLARTLGTMPENVLE